MTWFLYRLLPPRPDFGSTLSEAERSAMTQHVTYWTGHLNAGTAIVFSPVADPSGDWGLAVVNVESRDQINQLGDNDPAVLAGVCSYDALLLPAAIVQAG
jgi:uncharacterized protein